MILLQQFVNELTSLYWSIDRSINKVPYLTCCQKLAEASLVYHTNWTKRKLKRKRKQKNCWVVQSPWRQSSRLDICGAKDMWKGWVWFHRCSTATGYTHVIGTNINVSQNTHKFPFIPRKTSYSLQRWKIPFIYYKLGVLALWNTLPVGCSSSSSLSNSLVPKQSELP